MGLILTIMVSACLGLLIGNLLTMAKIADLYTEIEQLKLEIQKLEKINKVLDFKYTIYCN